MGEFEKSRIEKALKELSKENLCTIIESTRLSVKECWKENIDRTSQSILLRKVSSRIDELSEEHWKREMESMEKRKMGF